ncbi:MAG: response regulator transcription factor [Bdellovibrionales bacterium]|nr:response regulator transcription factor [Bdellovibrionales bacterium]
MSKKRNDHSGFVKKITTLMKTRISQSDVVSLDALRDVAKSKKKPHDPKSILVIDDDSMIRETLNRALVREGYIVHLAKDASDIGDILENQMNRVDFIILDVGLPWIDGYELATVMKESDSLRNIPLIFMSGRTEVDDMKKGFQVGADDYIKKPFDLNKLLKTIRTLLTLRES